uniref:PH domain-containing protein n=1 Tax=Populus trichocarpa TaxID=3694 RepID=A0A3N7FW05_POPTR
MEQAMVCFEREDWEAWLHKKARGETFSLCHHLEECNIEEVPDEEGPPPKSSKDKKANGPDAKAPSLVFKITSKVPYKTVLKAHSAVVLKAESMADKVEWMNKISKVAQPSKGGQMRGVSPEGGPATRESLSDGSLKQTYFFVCGI